MTQTWMEQWILPESENVQMPGFSKFMMINVILDLVLVLQGNPQSLEANPVFLPPTLQKLCPSYKAFIAFDFFMFFNKSNQAIEVLESSPTFAVAV